MYSILTPVHDGHAYLGTRQTDINELDGDQLVFPTSFLRSQEKVRGDKDEYMILQTSRLIVTSLIIYWSHKVIYDNY